MSSRALRKAQRLREQAQLDKEHEQAESIIEPERAGKLSTGGESTSVFAILDDGEDEHTNLDTDTESDQNADAVGTQNATNRSLDSPKPRSSARRKKKKKKDKGRDGETASHLQAVSNNQVDEIDVALKALSTSRHQSAVEGTPTSVDSAVEELSRLLSIDTHHLHVSNEMRRLFGREVFEADHEEGGHNAAHRRHLPEDQAGLAEAVSGRWAQGGQGLPAILRRRNLFMIGKEDWPRATGGGPAMAMLEKRSGGITEYRFLHNQAYQFTQQEFEVCVMSMDPSLMVDLLRLHPYHVSTLLQVSEIAKQQRDHATCGDLLERTLFSFGKAVHNTFGATLAQGKARLDFRYPENREFWLAAWRYIANISMRATWRTAYEWARMLLSLDPEKDPYCIRLVIDQLALRARQAKNFLDLSTSNPFCQTWQELPNITYSQSLAYKAVNDDARAKYALCKSIELYPWVAARLLQELSVDKIFPAIWGITAQTSTDELHSELYVTQALDLWKAPEATAFLVRTASEVQATAYSQKTREISIDEARFVVLMDKPALLGLLPRSITAKINSMSDPLPPEDSIQSYDTIASKAAFLQDVTTEWRTASIPPPADVVRNNPGQFLEELRSLQQFFADFVPESLIDHISVESDAHEDTSNNESNPRPNDNVRALSELGFSSDNGRTTARERAATDSQSPLSEIQIRLQRLNALRQAFEGLLGEEILMESGDTVAVTPDWLATIMALPMPADPHPQLETHDLSEHADHV